MKSGVTPTLALRRTRYWRKGGELRASRGVGVFPQTSARRAASGAAETPSGSSKPGRMNPAARLRSRPSDRSRFRRPRLRGLCSSAACQQRAIRGPSKRSATSTAASGSAADESSRAETMRDGRACSRRRPALRRCWPPRRRGGSRARARAAIDRWPPGLLTVFSTRRQSAGVGAAVLAV